jgi:predicted DNA-binding transcriptional regulator AlpA
MSDTSANNSKNLPDIDPASLLIPPEVAKHFGVSARPVQRYANAGEFPNYRKIRSGFIIPGSDILAYLETNN